MPWSAEPCNQDTLTVLRSLSESLARDRNFASADVVCESVLQHHLRLGPRSAPPCASPAWIASLTLCRRVAVRSRLLRTSYFQRPCLALTSFGSWRHTPRDNKPSHKANPIAASRTVIQRSALQNRRSSHPHANAKDDENKNHEVFACTLLRKKILGIACWSEPSGRP